MSDFFWFSDAQWARIGPLLPTDTRGMARVDDRRVLSGIVHALRNGGRWADCPREVYGPKKTLYNRFVPGRSAASGNGYSARWRAAKTPPTGCSSIQPASRFIAAPAAEKGGLGPWHRPHQGNTKLHAVCDAKGRPLILLDTSVHDCGRPALYRPCRPPPNSSPTRAMTRDWLAEPEPRPSSHRARTARSNT